MRLTQLIEESFGKNLAAAGLAAAGTAGLAAGLTDLGVDYIGNNVAPNLGDHEMLADFAKENAVNTLVNSQGVPPEIAEKIVDRTMTPEQLNKIGGMIGQQMLANKDIYDAASAANGLLAGGAGAGMALGARAMMNKNKRG